MTITLDPPALRRAAHKLLDELLDKVGDVLLDVAIGLVDPDGAVEACRSTAPDEPPSKPHDSMREPRQAKTPEPAAQAGLGRRMGARVDGAVRAAAVIQDGVLRPCIYIPAVIAARAGLVIGERCDCQHRDRELLISPSSEGIKVGRCGNTERVRLTFFALKVAKRHPAEFAAHHLDAEHRLVIAAPAWWPDGTGTAPAARQDRPKLQPAAATPAAEGNGAQPHALHCAVCQEVKASKDLYECPRCAVLVCRPETSQCFESHVRREHHSKATNRAPIPKREEARA